MEVPNKYSENAFTIWANICVAINVYASDPDVKMPMLDVRLGCVW